MAKQRVPRTLLTIGMVVLAAMLEWVSSAGAQPQPGRTVSIEPAGPVVPGTEVTLDIGGYSPGSTVYAGVCKSGFPESGGLGKCYIPDLSWLRSSAVGPAGDASITYRVPSPATFDCFNVGSCVIAVVEVVGFTPDLDTAATTPLVLGPTVGQPAISLEDVPEFLDGDIVEVTGTGFAPNHRSVTIAQCSAQGPLGIDLTQCPNNWEVYSSNEYGDLEAVYTVRRDLSLIRGGRFGSAPPTSW